MGFVGSYDLPSDGGTERLRWVRPGTGRRPQVYCLSDRAWCADVHWWSGRTLGCLGDECPEWLHTAPRRRRLYLLVALQPPWPVWGLEVGLRCLDGIEEQLSIWGSLRGLGVQVRRDSEAVQAPVSLRWGPPHREFRDWPPHIGIDELLTSTWGQAICTIDAELARRADLVELPPPAAADENAGAATRARR